MAERLVSDYDFVKTQPATGMSTVVARSSAKSPPTHRGIGMLLNLVRDPFHLLIEAAARHDGLVRFRVGGREAYVVSHPDIAREALTTKSRIYQRGPIFDTFRAVIGDGLFTADGETWRRHRRMMTPMFHRRHIRALVGTITDVIAGHCQGWAEVAERGAPIDMFREMILLNVRILMRTLFRTGLDEVDARALTDASGTLFRQMNRGLWGFFVPMSLPLPGRRRMIRAIAILDRIVNRLIAERRIGGGPTDDLLGLLLSLQDEETGEGLSAREIRDEIFTTILAGYESTAATMSWMWVLLARDPGVDRRVREEVDGALGDRAPTLDDLRALPYVRRIIDETLRLYPAFPFVVRTAMEDDVIDGYRIPAGSIVILSIYSIHRDGAWWDDPERFDPDRFDPERLGAAQRNAYLPFGEGQRMCIGSDLALTEGALILSMISQRYERRLVPGCRIDEGFALTLHPAHGVPMTLRRRAP